MLKQRHAISHLIHGQVTDVKVGKVHAGGSRIHNLTKENAGHHGHYHEEHGDEEDQVEKTDPATDHSLLLKKMPI